MCTAARRLPPISQIVGPKQIFLLSAQIALSSRLVTAMAHKSVQYMLTLLQCNTFLGTVTYMSPERINSKPYSFAADIWCFALLWRTSKSKCLYNEYEAGKLDLFPKNLSTNFKLSRHGSVCRSLGLSLLECVTGRYPFDAAAGPLVLMMQVCFSQCAASAKSSATSESLRWPSIGSQTTFLPIYSLTVQILKEEIPVPKDEAISTELRDFLERCLCKDSFERAHAEELLQHPFITQEVGSSIMYLLIHLDMWLNAFFSKGRGLNF